MKQITMIFLAVCLFLLPDFPMTVYAAEVERNRGLTVTDTEEYPELPEKSTAETTTKPENQTMNKKTGNLYIQNAGEGTGEKLSGAVFVIYRKGNKKNHGTNSEKWNHVIIPSRRRILFNANQSSTRLWCGNCPHLF